MSQKARSGQSAPASADASGAAVPAVNTANVQLALARNREFADAKRHEGLAMFPVTMFVIACIDPRVDPAHILGLKLGEAVIVRNGGGRVTSETIETVAFMAQVVENFAPDSAGFEVAVIHHTQCGTGFLADDEFRGRYAERIGADATTLPDLAVVDPVASVVTDVDRLQAARAMFPAITFSGHVYDVTTGLIETVVPAAAGVTASIGSA